MRRKRRTFSAEFKARVALDAIRGIKTLNQIAHEHGVLPGQVTAWKKEALEGLGLAFGGRDRQAEELEKARKRNAVLERKIGQLAVEAEFLEKKCVQLGVDLSERP
jgi:transposase-like protein